MNLDPEFLRELFSALNKGLFVSLQLIIPSALLGIAIGIVVGIVRVYGPKPLRTVADGYVALFRGTPLVAQLFMWYYGLPNLGIMLSASAAAIVGFGMCSGAYHSEYIRGGLLSIKRGQLTAAQALGFSPVATIATIILPQAIRRALPGCGNEIIYLIKYSSLAHLVTCLDLTGEAYGMAARTYEFTAVFLVTGAYYLILVSLATILLARVEQSLSLPGFERKRGPQ